MAREIENDDEAYKVAEWLKANKDHPRYSDVRKKLTDYIDNTPTTSLREAYQNATPFGRRVLGQPAPNTTIGPNEQADPRLRELPPLPTENIPERPASEARVSTGSELNRQFVRPVGEFLRGGLAAAELGITAATGAYASAAGGLGGALRMAAGASPEQAARTVEAAQRAGTIMPWTDVGKEVMGGVSTPIESYDRWARDTAEKAGFGVPLLSTIVYSALNMVGPMEAAGPAVRTFKNRRVINKMTNRLNDLGISLRPDKLGEELGLAMDTVTDGQIPRSRGEAMAGVPGAVAEARINLRDARNEAFDEARATNAYVRLDEVDTLVDNVDRILKKFNPEGAFNDNGTPFRIEKTDKTLNAIVKQIRGWQIAQRRATSRERTGPVDYGPRERREPGTAIVPAGERVSTPTEDYSPPFPNVPSDQGRLAAGLHGVPQVVPVRPPARGPGMTTIEQQALPPPGPGTAVGPARRLSESRDVVPAGPRRTEETITGRTDGYEPTDTRGPGLVHLNHIDGVMQRIKRRLPSSDKEFTAAETALLQIKDAVDDYMGRMLEKDLIVGDPTAVEKWRRARSLSREYWDKFKTNKVIWRMATKHDVTPTEFRAAIFGANKTSTKPVAAPIIRKLKAIFGEDSPEMNAMRLEFLSDATRSLQKTKPNRVDVEKFVQYYDDLQRYNKDTLEELSPYIKTGLDEIYKIAKAATRRDEGFAFSLNPYVLISRFLIGHQIARKGAAVNAGSQVLQLMFGKTNKQVKREIIAELTGVDPGEPMFRNKTAMLQGLWATIINDELEEANAEVQ